MLEKRKSFYFQKPSENGNMGDFVFDDLYKNARQKNRFEKDPNYKYFNMIIKMKSQFGHKRKDLYDQIFTPYQQNSQKNDKKIQSFRSVQVPGNKKKTLHVQQLNKRSFKIYRDKKASFFQSNEKTPTINDINFQIHFKTAKPTVHSPIKTQIKSVIAQYDRIKNNKRANLQRQRAKTTAKSARSNMSQNLRIGTSTLYKKANNVIKIV